MRKEEKTILKKKITDDELLGKAVQLKEEEKNKPVKKDKKKGKKKRINGKDVV